MKLYEIKEDILRLAEMDLDEQTMQDTLEGLQYELEEKADNIASLIKQLEAEKAAIGKEVDALMVRMTQKQVKADNLKRYLFNTFKALNVDKIETPRNVLQVKLNPESVELDDVFFSWAKTQAPHLLTFPEPKPNKTLIKEAIKHGQDIVGASLIVKERLVVK